MSRTPYTLDGSEYTSYASVAEADKYNRIDRFRERWQPTTTAKKQEFLIIASAELDRLGVIDGVLNPVNADLEKGVSLLAGYLSAGNHVTMGTGRLVNSQTNAGITVRFGGTESPIHVEARAAGWPVDIYRIVQPYLRSTVSDDGADDFATDTIPGDDRPLL